MSKKTEIRLRRTPLPLIETAYANVGQPRQQWLDAIRMESERLFDGVVDAGQVWEFSFDSSGGYRTLGLSANQPFRSTFHIVHALFPRKAWRDGHLGGPVPTLLDALGADASHPAYQTMNRLGVWEMAGAVGVDPSGQGVVLSWFRRQTGPLPARVRHTLERVAAHMARAVRLRNRRGRDDAVLAPDGRLLHAEADARDEASRDALREAARRMDRSRLRTSSTSPEEAIDMWNALVEGRWSLVERFESDGRRILVARRNDPATHATRALTEGERKVAALLGLNHSQKLIAYELGLSEGRVSTLARSAMDKLAVKSRAELIELQGAIVAASEPQEGASIDL